MQIVLTWDTSVGFVRWCVGETDAVVLDPHLQSTGINNGGVCIWFQRIGEGISGVQSCRSPWDGPWTNQGMESIPVNKIVLALKIKSKCLFLVMILITMAQSCPRMKKVGIKCIQVFVCSCLLNLFRLCKHQSRSGDHVAWPWSQKFGPQVVLLLLKMQENGHCEGKHLLPREGVFCSQRASLQLWLNVWFLSQFPVLIRKVYHTSSWFYQDHRKGSFRSKS